MKDDAARILIPLFSTLGGLFGLFFLAALLLCYLRFFYDGRAGRILLGNGLPGSYDDAQQLLRDEERYLPELDDVARQSYLGAKAFQEAQPPESVSTDISLSQYLSIQEKGVSAWEFEPDLETTNCFVECRTEIAFYDRECCVQTNLPIPRQNDVYYFEAKMYDLPESTKVAVGVATKPYPTFRLPGYNRHSVAYSSDGERRHNEPFKGRPYGPAIRQGDVIGVGYRSRSGTVFFTRNGKKLEEATTGQRRNLFPTIGADGPCTVHVNFGQAGFVFIEANVKKWGLAPMNGTLAPPPAYGSSEITDSVLLAAGYGAPSDAHSQSQPQSHSHSQALAQAQAQNDGGASGFPSPGDGRGGSREHRASDISLANLPRNGPPSYASSARHSRRSAARDEGRDLLDDGTRIERM